MRMALRVPMRRLLCERHSDAVVGGLFCLQHNVTADLMDLLVTPMTT